MSYYHPLSYWEHDAYLDKIDVAIIGGGIVGMNAALRLKEVNQNLKVAVLERSSLGTAASSRNAGFACYGSPSEIISDLEVVSENDVFRLIRRRVDGLELLKKTAGIDALRYVRTGGHEVFMDSNELAMHLDKLDTVNRIVTAIDPSLKFYQAADNKGMQSVKGIISNDWEGQLHPGYMTASLRRLCQLRGINVFTNFQVENLEDGNEFTINGVSTSIRARKVILCNNAFASSLLDIETNPGRNQVLLTSPIDDLHIHGSYHYDKGYVYFRKVDNRVLIGGGRNIAYSQESTDRLGQTETIRKYLLDILNKHILVDHSYQIEYEWSGILGFNGTKQPIVRQIYPGKFVAVGLGGMGVAIGSLVGKEVADLLLQS